MTNVLAPVTPPFDPATAQTLSRYPQGSDGYIIGLFRVFANSRRFLTGKGVVNLLDKDSPLTLREREIVILRTCANLKCEYEWGVHVATFATAAGLSEEEVAATTAGTQGDCWSDSEHLLIACIDAWCAEGSLNESLLNQFRDRWNLEQQLEVMALVGNYHTISFVANTSCLDLEPGTPTFT